MAEDPAPSRPVGMTAGLAPSSRRNGRDALLLVAFAAIYLVWGSTYLAIRYAVETVPPQLMAGRSARDDTGTRGDVRVRESGGRDRAGRRRWERAGHAGRGGQSQQPVSRGPGTGTCVAPQDRESAAVTANGGNRCR